MSDKEEPKQDKVEQKVDQSKEKSAKVEDNKEAKTDKKVEVKGKEEVKVSKQPVSTKIKKKNWYQIVAPKIFNGAMLGETIVYDQNAMVGKTVTQNLMNLTNDSKRQNVNIKFEHNLFAI